MRRPSSHDVARRAGVSQSTVSLVLNGRTEARISQETRNRVFAAAEELHYTRNATAHALVTGKTHRIGIVLNDPSSFLHRESYHADLMTGLIKGALLTKYNILLHSANYRDWKDLYNDIMGGAEDGVLLIGRLPGDEITTALLDSQFPTVCVSYRPNHKSFHAVDCDNEQGGYLAVRHLLECGCKHIVMVYPEDDSSWARERKIGSERAISESGMNKDTLTIFQDKLVFSSDGAFQSHLLNMISKVEIQPDGLFFSDEFQAQMLLERFKSLGIRAPDDIAVVSFNSTTVSERSRPPMTSIYQPLADIGERAFITLVDILEGRSPSDGLQKFPVRLDMRESTGYPSSDQLPKEFV